MYISFGVKTFFLNTNYVLISIKRKSYYNCILAGW